MKNLLYILSIFAFSACKNISVESTDQPIKPVLDQKLKSYAIEGTDMSQVISFDYDAKGLVSKKTVKDLRSNTTSTEVYLRNTAGKITSIERKEATGSAFFIVSYANGRVSEIAGAGVNKTIEKFSYNADSVVVKLNRAVYVNSLPSFSGALNLEWQNGNVKTRKNSLEKGEYEEENWQYETRANPLAAFYEKFVGLPQTEPILASKTLPVSQLQIFSDKKYRYSPTFNVDQQLTQFKAEIFNSPDWKANYSITLKY